jgi:hypothetical protein
MNLTIFISYRKILPKICLLECYMLFGSIGGGFCSTIALFSLPLLMLGMVPPIIIRLRATMIETIGVTAGKLYAVSTIGSLAGTIGTGFFLIPTIGNNEIFLGCAAVLLFFSGVGWVFIEKKSMAVALIIIAAAIPFSSMLAQKLRGFEQCDASVIYRHFVKGKGKIRMDGQRLTVRFPRKAHNPILRNAPWHRLPNRLSWLNNVKLELEFK